MASNLVRRLMTVALAGGLSVGLVAQQATSQSGTDATKPGAQMRPAPAAAPGDPAVTSDFSRSTVIAPRDKISVRTLNFPQFTVDNATVDVDGTIDFGPIGRVKVAGLTPRQLESDLKNRLNPDWVINPQVSVDLVPAQSKRVMVNGAVRSPMDIPFAGKMTVMQAIVAAGSLSDAAGDRAFIIRGNPDGSMPSADQMSDAPKIYVDLHKLNDLGDLTENYTLNDGDYLYVERAEPFTINGEIKGPGQYPVRNGLTVQQAIAVAGGFTDKASKGGVKILRPTGDPKNPMQTIKVDNEKLLQTTKVKPGDTIMVPARIM